MRLLPLFLCLSLPSVLPAADPATLQIKSVYLMPMGNGLDQHLATQLTRARVFDVVTDPMAADAVLTDRIGPSFEQAFVELYPPPPPPEVKEEKAVDSPPPAEKSIGETLAERPDVPARVSSFSRSRGSVYLIDRKTKRVLWSDYQRPTNSRPDEVKRAADKLVESLADDLARLRNPQK
jgi:hypothetical protein